MKATETKKISLVRCSAYSIGLYAVILLGQLYIIIKNSFPLTPVYIGPIYLPLLISCVLLVLIIAAWVLLAKQRRNSEANDELADLNKYKAGYIAKYVSIFVFVILVLFAKDINLVLSDDYVGNALSIFLICLSIMELIQNIAFIILEKRAE